MFKYVRQIKSNQILQPTIQNKNKNKIEIKKQFKGITTTYITPFIKTLT